MSYNAKIANVIQQPSVGSIVTLYKIDAMNLGADTPWYFTNMIKKDSSGPVVFNTITYSPIDIKAEGFEITTEGTMPRPTVAVSNVNNNIASAVEDYNDLIGAIVTRTRTIDKYLDGESEADPLAVFPREIYVIQQKVAQNKNIIKWELTAKTDLDKLKIQKRQILRDYCTHTYRYRKDGNWVYGNCPYAGTDYFKSDGTVTTIEFDYCGRKLSDCKLRYPNTSDEIPTWAFPMVARTRL